MEKKVIFKNCRSQKLVGILHIPNVKKPPAVIMIHGLGGDKDEHGLFVDIAKKLCENGYMVLRFDCAGSGESDGNFRDVTIKSEAEDLRSAIEFVKHQEIDKDRICVIGLSLGALVSLVAYKSDIKLLILLSAAIMGNIIKERYKSNEKFMKELEEKGYFTKVRDWGSIEISKELFNEADNFNWKKLLEHIDANIVLIHGSNDDVVPVDYAKKAYKYIKSGVLEIIEGSDHNYRKPEYEKRLIDIILFYLGNWL